MFFDPLILSEADFMAKFLSGIEILDSPSNTRDFEDAVIVEYDPRDSSIVVSADLLSNALFMQQLEGLFVTTYNDLSRAYCDPCTRQLLSVNFVLVGAINSFGNIPVNIELVGTCSNCEVVDLSIYDVPTSVVPLRDSTANETDLIFFLRSACKEENVGRDILQPTSAKVRFCW